MSLNPEIQTTGDEFEQPYDQGWLCSACGCPFPRPIAVPVKEFCRLVGCKNTTAFHLERDGKIETRKVRGRKVVLMRSIDALLQL
jgi:hypothetical protein